MNRPFASSLAGVALATVTVAAIAQAPMASGSRRVGAQPTAAQSAHAQAVAGEVPAALLDRIRMELASEQGVSADEVKVLSAEAVNWPNGALGCPRPGVMYTQAIVPGYRVELEAGGRRFTYHAATSGAFKRCDRRIGAMAPGSTR